jgi:hypothetical protein
MLLYDSISGLSKEHMMSQRSKRELLVEIQSRYLKAKKAKLLNQYLGLNPAQLRRFIDKHVAQLWSTLCYE